ncbi:MAG: polyprenyl synthetase family protein [Desulfurococcales archaeon]|nr:polyprenyl synthetase family protein [Desulfurococcales archaeon]
MTERPRYKVLQSDYDRAKLILAREWERSRRLIDDRLKSVVTTLGDDGLPDVADFIAEGGKRFRGFLTIIIARALGGDEESAIDAAVAVELVQAASLAIDDIIDKDKWRRGREAAWIRFGIERTVLSSLLLIPIAQKIVEKLGFKALFHVIRAWESTVRGEIMDFVMARRLGPERYIKLVELKTAALFRLATLLGALAARASDETLNAASEYGRLIGIIYQVADDLADYTRAVREGRPLGPGEELFIRWARSLDPENPLEAAKKFIREKLSEAVEAARALNPRDKDLALLLELIPAFLIQKLLSEAGLDHDNIFHIL